MGTLQIEVGDLHFTARWEPAAPRTIDAIRVRTREEAILVRQ